MRIKHRSMVVFVVAASLFVAGNGFGKDVCVKHVSILEEGTIATITAPKVQKQAEASSPKEGKPDTEEEAGMGVQIDYGDSGAKGTLSVGPEEPNTDSSLVDYGDSGTTSDLVDYGDSGTKSDLVDSGDTKSATDDLVFRADSTQDEAGESPGLVIGDSAGPVKSKPSAANPFESLISGAMGVDPKLAGLFQMNQSTDGFHVQFEDLAMKVLQTPPPKTMEEAFGNLAKSGDAHVRIDFAKGKKPSGCIPGKWNGKVLSLLTKSGHAMNLKFAGAKKVKGNLGSQKGIKRRVYKFKGPMSFDLKAK